MQRAKLDRHHMQGRVRRQAGGVQCHSKDIKPAESPWRLHRSGSGHGCQLLWLHRKQESKEVQEVCHAPQYFGLSEHFWVYSSKWTPSGRLLVSLVSVELLIAFQLFFELWDILTERAVHTLPLIANMWHKIFIVHCHGDSGLTSCRLVATL